MKKYNILVIDPPWDVKKLTHKARPLQVAMDYNLLSLKDIYCLDIPSISSDNSWCFLWTTQKYLFDAKNILESWGFKYMFLMTWKKLYGKSEGMPLFGFRWNSEFILVGSKGKKQLWVSGKPLIKMCFDGVNVRHSQKPDEFYKMLDVFDGNKIDIFARKKRVGWDVWGDEIESDIELKLREPSLRGGK